MLITLLKKRMVGYTTSTVAAPPRSALKMFGGPMDIEEFRAAGDRVRYAPIPSGLMLLEHERMARVVHTDDNDDSPIEESPVPDGYELVEGSDAHNSHGACDGTFPDGASADPVPIPRAARPKVVRAPPKMTQPPDDISQARANAASVAAKKRRPPVAPALPTFNKRTLTTATAAPTSLDNLFSKMNGLT